MTNTFALERSYEQLVFDAIEHADDQVDSDALTALFLPACNKLGFDHIGAFSVRNPGGEMVGGYQAGSTNPQWADHYVEGAYFREDPIVRALPTTREVMIWSDLIGRKLPGTTHQMFDEAPAFGLGDGFVVPQHYLDGFVAAAIMTSPERVPASKRIRAAAKILATAYAASVGRLLAPRSPKGVALSARQLECLLWVRAGNSDWDIGEILGISEHTVKEHIEAARAKLGVRTRTQAVIEAISRRLIPL